MMKIPLSLITFAMLTSFVTSANAGARLENTDLSNAESGYVIKQSAVQTEQVVVTKVQHLGNISWKITAAGGIWYFENGETEGKIGFSSAIDGAGND